MRIIPLFNRFNIIYLVSKKDNRLLLILYFSTMENLHGKSKSRIINIFLSLIFRYLKKKKICNQMYAPYIYIFLFNLEKLTCRGNKHTIHTDGIRFSCIFTIFFSLFVFLPCKFSSIHIYCRIIYIYLKCSSHGPAAIFTPAAPPLFTYLDYELFSRRI